MGPLDRLRLALQSLSGRKKAMGFWALKFLALLAAFIICFYPSQRERSSVSANIRSLREEINGLKKISVNLLTPEDVQKTEARVKDFESKLVDSSKASSLLDLISDEAEKNHFSVIQIYSDNPVPIKDEQNKDMEIEGKKLLWLPVSFRVEADYKSFGDFLHSLSENIQKDFVIESLQLQRSSSQADTLQCDITLSFIAK